jgi:hypothetical protein
METVHSPRMIGAVRRIQLLQASGLGDSAACIAPDNSKSVQQEVAPPEVCVLVLQFSNSNRAVSELLLIAVKATKVMATSHHEQSAIFVSPSLATTLGRRAGRLVSASASARAEKHMSPLTPRVAWIGVLPVTRGRSTTTSHAACTPSSPKHFTVDE